MRRKRLGTLVEDASATTGEQRLMGLKGEALERWRLDHQLRRSIDMGGIVLNRLVAVGQVEVCVSVSKCT